MTGSLAAADGIAMMADLLQSALDPEGNPSEADHLPRQTGCRQEVAAWWQEVFQMTTSWELLYPGFY